MFLYKKIGVILCFLLKHQSVEDECKQITEKDAFITFFFTVKKGGKPF